MTHEDECSDADIMFYVSDLEPTFSNIRQQQSKQTFLQRRNRLSTEPEEKQVKVGIKQLRMLRSSSNSTSRDKPNEAVDIFGTATEPSKTAVKTDKHVAAYVNLCYIVQLDY